VFVPLKPWPIQCFYTEFFCNVNDFIVFPDWLNLVVMQTKAAYDPDGAASEGKRAASPWSPPGSRIFLWRYVYAEAAG